MAGHQRPDAEEHWAPLLNGDSKKEEWRLAAEREGEGEGKLGRRVWQESRKLWVIVAPAIFSRVVTYGMNVITQAFAGHLGDLELAAISIANTVVVGFNFGLMLGMASALETLCGQAFGARKFHMMGVYMQRSWLVLLMCAVLLLPMYFFAEDVLLLTGQSPQLSRMAGRVSVWFIPLHFSFAFLFPLQRFLQCQMKNFVNAAVSAAALGIHVFVSWLFVSKCQFGLVGIALTLNFSWWATAVMLFAYVSCGGCPETWHGFSVEAFAGMSEFVKLSSASGVMLCLENWYYRILILLTGNLKNAALAVDALSICMTINGWEMMIPLAFFAGTGVRVANELGAGNGRGARFATIVSSTTSLVIGLFFWVLIMALHNKFALVFTSSAVVLDAVDNLSVLLAFTILLNSIQPVLSDVADFFFHSWSAPNYCGCGCWVRMAIHGGVRQHRLLLPHRHTHGHPPGMALQPRRAGNLGGHDRRHRRPNAHSGHHDHPLRLGKGGHDREHPHGQDVAGSVMAERIFVPMYI